MKNIITITAFLLSLQTARACEICGCGVGNFYMGMVPKFNNQFVGIRYRYMGFTSRMQDAPEEFSNDSYHSMELWSGWRLGKKWQAMVFIPYQSNVRQTDDGEKKANGLGDITLLANFRVLNKALGRGNHQLLIGGGFKAPTGSYKIDFSDPQINLGDPSAQSGTGSLDFLVNVNHNISIQKWGVNTMLSYKANTVNPDQYKFGNRFMANSLIYYRFGRTTFSIAPVLGALYEQSTSNNYQRDKIEMTGGYATFGLAGVEMSFNNVAFGFNVQAPIEENLSENQTQAKARGLIHLTFTL